MKVVEFETATHLADLMTWAGVSKLGRPYFIALLDLQEISNAL